MKDSRRPAQGRASHSVQRCRDADRIAGKRGRTTATWICLRRFRPAQSGARQQPAVRVGGAEPPDVLLRRQDPAESAVVGAERDADRADREPHAGRHRRDSAEEQLSIAVRSGGYRQLLAPDYGQIGLIHANPARLARSSCPCSLWPCCGRRNRSLGTGRSSRFRKRHADATVAFERWPADAGTGRARNVRSLGRGSVGRRARFQRQPLRRAAAAWADPKPSSFGSMPPGAARLLAELDGIAVQAIAIDQQDRVYAATSPDGKVYRVDAAGKADVFYDPKTKYIWAWRFRHRRFVCCHGRRGRNSPRDVRRRWARFFIGPKKRTCGRWQ